jgi:two-component system cell cycle sensor histidine kinase/response regulator CckA
MPGAETILVVDDERSVLGVMEMMLQRAGYQVLTTAGAQETLTLLQEWPDLSPDLVLMDFVLPDMNGVELVRRLRELRPGLPVLYFSAYSEHEELRPALARGVPYLAKPFTTAQLNARVRQLLDGRGDMAADAR